MARMLEAVYASEGSTSAEVKKRRGVNGVFVLRSRDGAARGYVIYRDAAS